MSKRVPNHNPENVISIEHLVQEKLSLARAKRRLDEEIQKDAQADAELAKQEKDWTK